VSNENDNFPLARRPKCDVQGLFTHGKASDQSDFFLFAIFLSKSVSPWHKLIDGASDLHQTVEFRIFFIRSKVINLFDLDSPVP
jgi:hypothetical protein